MYVGSCLNDAEMAAHIVKRKIQSMLHDLQRFPSILDVHAPPVGLASFCAPLVFSVLMVDGSVIVDAMLND